MLEYKRILDSVHGYIKSPKSYFNIIDSIWFQRLRRIEQTSGRALFPCARHDRFIHSLGVFHLGCMVVDSVTKKNYRQLVGEKEYDFITKCYLIACLLHDIAHTPFSHTFENYYDNAENNLKVTLKDYFQQSNFAFDWDNQLNVSAPHEIMSAIIAITQFENFFGENNIDIDGKELVARMIIGCQYIKDKYEMSFRNAFIELIHGVIDVDGLDYACRDAWASGYSTSQIDIVRLIDSIHIQKDNTTKLYQLCFSFKAINEIESLLSVKNFQQYNVINHHTIVYEQELLKQAMQSVACFHYDMLIHDFEQRKVALQKLCSFESYQKPISLPKSNILLFMPSDDDFVHLMKYIPNDKYVSQWLSRKYDLVPLWKSRADFYSIFPILLDKKYHDECWLFRDDCKEFIANVANVSREDVWILKATPVYKGKFADKLYITTNDTIQKYTDLLPRDKNSYSPEYIPFRYIYVPKTANKQLILGALREEIKKYVFG